MSAPKTIYQLAYQISPIILTGGIAQLVPGNMLPIIALTEIGNLAGGLLQGSLNLNLDEYYAHYHPLPGGTLQNNQIGKYPFANQTVAANAIIAQPKNISMIMKCPTNKPGSRVTKQMTDTALQSALELHNMSGGTYTILTPSFMYTGCVMLMMKDASSGDEKHVQEIWQLDFEQPLTSASSANTVLSNLMGKISGGTFTGIKPDWSGYASIAMGQGSSVLNSVKNSFPFITSVPFGSQPAAPITGA